LDTEILASIREVKLKPLCSEYPIASTEQSELVDHRHIVPFYGFFPKVSCEIFRIPMLVDLIPGIALDGNLDFRRGMFRDEVDIDPGKSLRVRNEQKRANDRRRASHACRYDQNRHTRNAGRDSSAFDPKSFDLMIVPISDCVSIQNANAIEQLLQLWRLTSSAGSC
jgi:hypothetical protein